MTAEKMGRIGPLEKRRLWPRHEHKGLGLPPHQIAQNLQKLNTTIPNVM